MAKKKAPAKGGRAKASKKPPPKASKKIAPDTVVRCAKDVLARKNSDGTVAIMRLDEDSYYYTLSDIAAEFWSLIDGKSSIGAIKERLMAKYSPPAGIFDRDVAKLLSSLESARLIERA